MSSDAPQIAVVEFNHELVTRFRSILSWIQTEIGVSQSRIATLDQLQTDPSFAVLVTDQEILNQQAIAQRDHHRDLTGLQSNLIAFIEERRKLAENYDALLTETMTLSDSVQQSSDTKIKLDTTISPAMDMELGTPQNRSPSPQTLSAASPFQSPQQPSQAQINHDCDSYFQFTLPEPRGLQWLRWRTSFPSDLDSFYLSTYTGGKRRATDLTSDQQNALCASLSPQAQKLLRTTRVVAFPDATNSTLAQSGILGGVSSAELLQPTRMFQLSSRYEPSWTALDSVIANMSASEQVLVRDFFYGPRGVHINEMINSAYMGVNGKGMVVARALSACVLKLNVFALFKDLGFMTMDPLEFLLYGLHQQSQRQDWKLPEKKPWGRGLMTGLCRPSEVQYYHATFFEIYEKGKMYLDNLPRHSM